MRVTGQSVTAAFLTLTAIIGYALTPAAAARGSAVPPGPRAPVPPVIRWTPCPEDDEVQCGTMRVPVDWSAPLGAPIDLALARRPATDPARRIGVLMVNPGGPGASAVTMALDTEFFSAEVRARFDIVGLDPRGVGRSSPILCDQNVVDAKPSPLVVTPDGFAALAAYNQRLAADCESRSGAVFRHADTLSVVRDTEEARIALGEQQISYYGASYGSLIGQQYGELYPDRLRALVLDSVMDHTAGVDDFLGRTAEAAQDAFDEFVAWCARDTRCVLRGQDIRAIWSRLMQQARAGELVNPYDPPSRLGVWELMGAAFSAFYDPQWYSFAHYIKEASNPEPAAVARRGPGLLDLTPYSFPAVICQDWALPVGTFEEYRKRLDTLAVKAPQVLASPLALTAATGCLGWTGTPANPQRPVPPAAGPVLVVNSRHDPATPYAWARQLTRRLGARARLLTYDGWGHVAYSHSPCVRAAADRYLTTLALPAIGASCPGVEPAPYGVG
ncbi:MULTISPECIES: alpha/beta hydrolase [Actinoplanes]|uniref:alpha/beta hydrolase n=1 Tax=Actinoplanes TaxID=1865 RepID=UPI0005F2A227|nr:MULTISPECIES: alpha/beta hydrolase [Actinoplanes]GLY06093.1 peptidase [Actinoplanes sp. NBRC 101535]